MSGRTLNLKLPALLWVAEFYLLNDNGTFTKSRTRDGNTSLQGHIKSQLAGPETYFELTYSSQSDIIGSCYGNLKKNFIS
jgi:hypothetical protein